MRGAERQDLRIEDLLRDALPEALAEQDGGRFLAWVRAHIAGYFPEQMRAQMQPAMIAAFAWSFGRALWNALPLPRNGFRPDPIPEPGRNERCPCGSGRKYKQCCLRLPALPVTSEDIWPAVLEAMDEGQRAAALRSGGLPRNALVSLAQSWFEEDRAKSAVKLLEPLFLPRPVAHDETMECGFDTLCDAYDELGWTRKKPALIAAVIAEVPSSPLLSAAWQRRTLMAMDRHDLPGAREALHHAQCADPEHPMLAILEVQLLIAEHKPEHARERAKFFVQRLRRSGFPPGEPPLSFLIDMTRDPVGTVSAIALDQVGDRGRGLLDWIASVEGRALPAYSIAASDELPVAEGPGELVERLIEMRVERTQAEQAAERLPEPADDDETARNEDASSADPIHVLRAPEALAATESAWHECFPLATPFALDNEPVGVADVWDPDVEETWTRFLEGHPECFDSLDVLDDLATAAMQHPQSGLPSLNQSMLMPLLERARSIVRRATLERDDLRLAWFEARNRSALRALARLVSVLRAARPGEAADVARLLLRLNPDDNHGFRAVAINLELQRDENRRALEIAEAYPDDLMVQVCYGRALALFRLGRKVEATGALRDAVRDSPRVADYLLRAKARQPKLSEFGVTYGGDDEAWLYREDMRSVWVQTPEAMDWLRAEENRWRRSVGKNARKPRGS